MIKQYLAGNENLPPGNYYQEAFANYQEKIINLYIIVFSCSLKAKWLGMSLLWLDVMGTVLHKHPNKNFCKNQGMLSCNALEQSQKLIEFALRTINGLYIVNTLWLYWY